MEPTAASTTNPRDNKAVRYTTAANIAAAPIRVTTNLRGQDAGQQPASGDEPPRTDWHPAVLHRQVRRIWQLLVFALFLLLLATAVHVVQFFVTPANFSCSQHCHCADNRIVRRLQAVQEPQGESKQT